MTPIDVLARMRCTAALLACSPALSARLVHDDVVIVEVMRPPFPVREHAVLPPCWFRGLVADGVRGDLVAGSITQERMERLVACRIDLGTRDGATLLPGEVVRIDTGTTWLHLHAAPEPVDLVEPVVRDLSAELEGQDDGSALVLHPASDLDVTVLALTTSPDDVASDAAAELLHTVAMRLAIARLERELATVADHPARPFSSPRPDTHKEH